VPNSSRDEKVIVLREACEVKVERLRVRGKSVLFEFSSVYSIKDERLPHPNPLPARERRNWAGYV
jgi:hypothetical protein